MESFFNSLGDIKSISNANRELCEAAITVAYFEDTTKRLKLNKNLGTMISHLLVVDVSGCLQNV